EDGIRDRTVTGVQTCALPILSAAHGVMRFIGGKLSKNEKAVSLLTPTGVLAVRGGIFLASVGSTGTDVTFLYGQGLTVSNPAGRSEERRVGKEWRCRGAVVAW